MTAIVCTLLSAIGFYFSIGLGDQWWLAWLAPIPVLWLAFGDTKAWTVFFAAWVGCALGSSSILRAYAGTMPTFVLVLGIAGPGLMFAGSVMGARRVQRALGPIAGMFAFAALWTMFDFLVSFDRAASGSVASPAAAEVGAPMLIQSASLFGYLAITFLLGAVSAGIALSLRTRDMRPAAIAIALFAVNAGFGFWRMSQPPSGSLKVALVESDDTVGKFRKEDKFATFKAIDAYVQQVDKLRDEHIDLIVLPENISRVAPAWRDEAQAKLAAAASDTHTTLVAGFNTYLDGAQRNVSWSFSPGTAMPVTYEKRRLVPVLESAVFTPGPGPSRTCQWHRARNLQRHGLPSDDPRRRSRDAVHCSCRTGLGFRQGRLEPRARRHLPQCRERRADGANRPRRIADAERSLRTRRCARTYRRRLHDAHRPTAARRPRRRHGL